MFSFLISLAALVVGYILYGKFVERRFGADPTRKTPAITKADGCRVGESKGRAGIRLWPVPVYAALYRTAPGGAAGAPVGGHRQGKEADPGGTGGILRREHTAD